MFAGETTGRLGVGRFFAWWARELAMLVPAGLRRFLTPNRAGLEIEFTPEIVTVRRARGGGEPLARYDRSVVDPPALRAGVERAARSAGRGRRSVALLLSDPRVLCETIRLPAAAAENLRETVLYQLDRLTPFTADEVYFDCRQTDAPAADGSIAVELLVAPRAVIDDAVRQAVTWGLEVTSVSPVGNRRQGSMRALNLLPRDNVRDHGVFGRLNAAMAVIALLLFGATLYLPYARDRETARLYSARIELLRAEARVAAELKKQIAAAEKERDRIAERRKNAISVTRALNDLTRLVPDSSWVTQFRLTGDRGQIVGHGPSSSEIIGLIEQSDRLSGARMLSPVRRDVNRDIERFNLSFSLRPDPAETEARDR